MYISSYRDVFESAPQVVSIRKINDRTPAFVLLYRAFKTSDKSSVTEGLPWTLAQSNANPPELDDEHGEKVVFCVSASSQDQKLVLKFLNLNASLVPPTFNISPQLVEAQYKASVLPPHRPALVRCSFEVEQQHGLCRMR